MVFVYNDSNIEIAKKNQENIQEESNTGLQSDNSFDIFFLTFSAAGVLYLCK